MIKRSLLALLLVSCVAPSPVKHPEQTAMTDKEVFRIGLGSMVEIAVIRERNGQQVMGFGTGSVVGYDKDGKQLVLTAAHVVDPADLPMVRPAIDREFGSDFVSTAGVVVAHDPVHDLALIRLAVALDRTALRLGKEPRQGDTIYFFESPPDLPTTFGRGVLTRTHYPGRTNQARFQYTGITFYGGSGGAVLDEYGQLIGLVDAVDAAEDPHEEGKTIVIVSVGYAINQRAIAAFLGKAGVK